MLEVCSGEASLSAVDQEEAQKVAAPWWTSYFFGDLIRQYARLVIRPPRATYTNTALGPKIFELSGKSFQREDLQLTSSRGHNLCCSFYHPNEAHERARPCVIYLHGNCGNRLDAFTILPNLLPQGINIFSWDFAGCGQSGGDYISMGVHEEEDLKLVLRHLRQTGLCSSVALWGRSMGACVAMMRAAKGENLVACVLDSPYRDFHEVAQELVGEKLPLPGFMFELGWQAVCDYVRDEAEFDPDDIMPLKYAPLAKCPALFAVARDDTQVLPHHTPELKDLWGGPSKISVFDGGHNGARPSWFLIEATEFLTQCFRMPLPMDGNAALNPGGGSRHVAPPPGAAFAVRSVLPL
mmetsp:Transcript_62357/g.115740  ORF Transcript_62357/g.115740 Transcript_62357/m.115740 type:complete len:352 (+) Transcript_62357:86-1141(+)